MNLTFSSSSGTDLVGFITQELYAEIRNTFTSILDESRLEAFDKYLNSGNVIEFEIPVNKRVRISTKNILIGAINNLIYTKQNNNNNYIIEINPNEYIPNMRAKFIDIAKLVNYGTLSVQAYDIFDKTFELVAKRLPQVYKNYLEGAQ